jgi:hypothetical protein
MVDHVCKGLWVTGPVGTCPHHHQRGKKAADVRPYNDERTRVRTEGVAQSGEISKQGTVSHKDYWSGKLQVVARPETLKVSMNDIPGWSFRRGRWIHDATGTALEWQTIARSTAFSVKGI